MPRVSVSSVENLQVHVEFADHSLLADEPAGVGDGKGPTPYDLLLSALGSCTVMTLLMYARRKEWPLRDVRMQLEHDRIYEEDNVEVETDGGLLERYTLDIELVGELDEEQQERLAYIATRCPIRKTLSGTPHFEETVTVTN